MRFVVGTAVGHTNGLPAALGTIDLPVENGQAVRELALTREADAWAGARWTINGGDFDTIEDFVAGRPGPHERNTVLARERAREAR